MPRQTNRMRTKIFILFSLIFFSCDNSIRFENPQPERQSNEKSIPKRIIGKYLNLYDSSSVTITANQIIRKIDINFSYHLSQLDSVDRANIKNDTSYSVIEVNNLTKTSTRIDFIVKGDSVFEHTDVIETLLNFSNGDILRKFKGHYFSNHLTLKDNWRVTKLTKTKNGLILGTITKKEDIENLRELTETKSDTVYNFNPTRKQFKRFIKEKGFSNEEFYTKIE